MRYLSFALLLLLSGCASQQFKDDTAKAWLGCEAPKCEALWAKAQFWLQARNYKLVTNTPQLIQTQTPNDRDVDHVAYTLTREQSKEGYPIIVVKGTTPSNLVGAYFSPAPAVNELFYYLMEERKK